VKSSANEKPGITGLFCLTATTIAKFALTGKTGPIELVNAC
jgi:hypothetical protein